MEIVTKMIVTTFNFLEKEYFYTPSYKVGDSALFIDSLHVEYVNEVKSREIIIGYTKSDLNNEIRYTFSVSITRTPYTKVEDFFSLDNYLQSKASDFSTSLVNNFDEAEAQKILIEIVFALKEHALNIIDGKVWLDKYYPRWS